MLMILQFAGLVGRQSWFWVVLPHVGTRIYLARLIVRFIGWHPYDSWFRQVVHQTFLRSFLCRFMQIWLKRMHMPLEIALVQFLSACMHGAVCLTDSVANELAKKAAGASACLPPKVASAAT